MTFSRTNDFTALPSGIPGLDDILAGGFRKGRTMLVTGGPGSGKTMFGVQFLTEGAVNRDEPGLLLSFEEAPDRLTVNFSEMTFPFSDALGKTLHLLDGRPSADTVAIGNFDLQGLIATLDALVRQHGIKRILIDAIDALFTLSQDLSRIRSETLRLLDWLADTKLTAIITLKSSNGPGRFLDEFDFAEFAVDGVIQLNSEMHAKLLQRTLRVVKRRGSRFITGEHPYTISRRGIRAMCSPIRTHFVEAETAERTSSGVERLDGMLAGGYLRGTTTLFSGLPGTSKTTFGAAFIAATCARGERSLFVGFDEPAEQMLRNVRSVGIDLATHRSSGLLHMESFAAGSAIADDFVLVIQDLIEEHKPTHIVLDPISALLKSGGAEISDSAIERLVIFLKSRGLSALFTTVSDSGATALESTPTRISTVADTWIHLDFAARGGERNRTLTIVKSRGTAHSAQTREVVLDQSGISLADVYEGGGDVLYGTARLEREQRLLTEQQKERQVIERRLQVLDEDRAALASKATDVALQLEQLARLRADLIAQTKSSAKTEHANAVALLAQRGSEEEEPQARPGA
jgi:circadian clock protein KaiC